MIAVAYPAEDMALYKEGDLAYDEVGCDRFGPNNTERINQDGKV